MRKAGAWQAGVLMIGLASSLVLAQSRTADCTKVDDDQARLKCYDEQSGRRKSPAPAAATNTPAAPSAVTKPGASVAPGSAAATAGGSSATAAAGATRASPPARAATAESAESTATAKDFGLDPETVRKRREAEHPEEPKAPDRIVARVKAVTTKPRGEYRITLEDGQVWEESQHTGGSPPEAGETVTIRRGMLGSYFLSRGTGLALRVQRTH